MKFRVIDVYKALVAASAVVRAGNNIVLGDKDEEYPHYIMKKITREKTQLQ